MRVLVVWGLLDTIEIFSPSRQLSSVDLPTLDRPMIATVPNFMVLTTTPVSCQGLALTDRQSLPYARTPTVLEPTAQF